MLGSGPAWSCSLNFYSPGLTQALHAHDLPSVAVLLSGDMQEAAGGDESVARTASLSVKPADVRHRNVVGAKGALVLSVSVKDPDLWEAALPGASWRWSHLASSRLKHLSTLLAGQANRDVETLVHELLAAGQADPATRGAPPRWLKQVEERLCDEPGATLGQMAQDADVHPVYLSRAFRAAFGVSPSEHRLERRTSLAIGQSLSGADDGSTVAHASGFSDQSHMCRSIRRMTGFSLTQLRSLFGRPGEPAFI